MKEERNKMNLSVILLVFFSAVMHAGWNLFARKEREELLFISRMLTIVAVAGFIPAVLSEIITHSLPVKAWVCVSGSGFFCGLYFYSLARAYTSSDFTIVYPVARSLPILFIALGDILRGRVLSSTGWLGILLVVVGCFLSPLRSFNDFSLRRYINKTGFWLVLTASGTVGYTLLDKIASEVVLQGSATAARYGYFFFFVTFLFYHLFFYLSGNGKVEKEKKEKVGWKLPVIASIFDFASYWFILWAYQLTLFASYVVAFRQLSILFGVIVAFLVYKEEGLFVRLIGAVLLTSGLIIIALFT